MSREIRCPNCGQETLLLREPVYEGFAKVGEQRKCSGCGQIFATEDDVPYVSRKTTAVFTAKDRSAAVKVFEAHEADRLCRYCVHYTVNPFRQWCGLHRKEVEATDTCSRFERMPEPESEAEAETPPAKPLF